MSERISYNNSNNNSSNKHNRRSSLPPSTQLRARAPAQVGLRLAWQAA